MENYEPVVRERRDSEERLASQYGAGKQAAAYLGFLWYFFLDPLALCIWNSGGIRIRQPRWDNTKPEKPILIIPKVPRYSNNYIFINYNIQ